MKQLRMRSCAKINLGLEILRKRADGYHDLNSIFIAIDLHDTITMDRSEEVLVECEPPVTERVEDNLVYKAACMLSDKSQQGAKIRVTKHIPSGGGLGGGSSNAACTLLGMSILYPEYGPLLAPCAKALGSDVTFFLHPGVALVQGRGEIVTTLDVTLPWYVLLVFPGIFVSTALAYSTLGITGEQPPTNLIVELAKALEDQSTMQDRFVNNLEPVVFTMHPELSTIKDALLESGALYAAMSGSGSTMYGLYRTAEQAEAARTSFSTLPTYICRPVDSSFYLP